MGTISFPPGFRFHPTDEELIIHYLRNQASSKPCPVPIIPEVNIYKFDPWQLPEKSEMVEGEWYFFTPRDRKYPNGDRPNRAAVSGYWKATGTDKAIYSKSKYVGLKKALVFYRGRPPKGSKTGWIMHEYRLDGSFANTNSTRSSKVLDEWVLCRIYEKKHHVRNRNNSTNMTEDAQECCPSEETVVTDGTKLSELEEKVHVFPRSCSLAHLMEPDYLISSSSSSASFLVDDSQFFDSIDEIFECKVGNNNGPLFSFPIHVDPLLFPFH